MAVIRSVRKTCGVGGGRNTGHRLCSAPPESSNMAAAFKPRQAGDYAVPADQLALSFTATKEKKAERFLKASYG